MSSQSPASEVTKNAIENTVSWYLADKLQDPATTIATKKFLTNQNRLVYLTRCNVAEVSVPRVKVQVFDRVEGGVRELGYQIFADHRMMKYENAMIFGMRPSAAADRPDEPVTEAEATALVTLLGSLGEARQTF